MLTARNAVSVAWLVPSAGSEVLSVFSVHFAEVAGPGRRAERDVPGRVPLSRWPPFL